MKPKRRKTTNIEVGAVPIGSDHVVSIQSMTKTDTRDRDATLAQIGRLAGAGCEIIRVAVPDAQAADALRTIVAESEIPVIADIHFDHRLALSALDNGVHGLRINPGNIGSSRKVREVVVAARERNVPIRIGVNSGSVEKELLERFGGPTAEAMVESALKHVSILESLDYRQIKISIKSSDVMTMIEANRILAGRCPYPLHLGVTEAGLKEQARIKSAIGIGALLSEGIGDTVRVSITGDPVDEVVAAREILKALGLRRFGPTLVSCPTCGRTQIDLIGLTRQVNRILEDVHAPITVAVMGCAVNGPGEAREADIGIAGGKEQGILFRRGRIIRKVPQEQLVDAFREELAKYLEEMEPQQ